MSEAVSSVSTPTTNSSRSDPDYYSLEQFVGDRVAGLTGPLFTTDVTDLFDRYLVYITADQRQHYNCRACRTFVENYGGLVTIDEDGHTYPVLWTLGTNNLGMFNTPVTAMLDLVCRAKVTGVFLNSEATWGRPETNGKNDVRWTHLSGTPKTIYKHPLLSAHQVMAQKKEDFGMLNRGLAEFPMEAVKQAVRGLESGTLYRSEKALGAAQWLYNLHLALEKAGKSYVRPNLVWRAVASAPEGFCHVKTNMIGTLLEDIVAGMDFPTIAERWEKKMDPLKYRRSQAAPTVGAIEAANKIFEKMQSAGSLARRFARLGDLTAFWSPSPDPVTPPPPGSTPGTFNHLLPKTKTVAELQLPDVTMTWSRFQQEVLPSARSMEFLVPGGNSESFCALVTAENPEATPILQWDGLEGSPRNPVSWFFYAGASSASMWNLSGRSWVPVRCITALPPRWYRSDLFKHVGQYVILILDGCRPTDVNRKGGGFFTEQLRAEYYSVRAVLEAHVKATAVSGAAEATACGYAMSSSGSVRYNCKLRVRSADGTATYNIDRWH